MSNTKPSVTYVRYDKKKNEGGKPSQQQSLENSMDLDLCLQTANWMLMENTRPKVKSVIDVEKADINQIRNVVPSLLSVIKWKEWTFCCNLSKGQGIFMFF